MVWKLKKSTSLVMDLSSGCIFLYFSFSFILNTLNLYDHERKSGAALLQSGLNSLILESLCALQGAVCPPRARFSPLREPTQRGRGFDGGSSAAFINTEHNGGRGSKTNQTPNLLGHTAFGFQAFSNQRVSVPPGGGSSRTAAITQLCRVVRGLHSISCPLLTWLHCFTFWTLSHFAKHLMI